LCTIEGIKRLESEVEKKNLRRHKEPTAAARAALVAAKPKAESFVLSGVRGVRLGRKRCICSIKGRSGIRNSMPVGNAGNRQSSLLRLRIRQTKGRLYRSTRQYFQPLFFVGRDPWRQYCWLRAVWRRSDATHIFLDAVWILIVLESAGLALYLIGYLLMDGP